MTQSIADMYPRTQQRLEEMGLPRSALLSSDESIDMTNKLRAELDLPPITGSSPLMATLHETESALERRWRVQRAREVS